MRKVDQCRRNDSRSCAVRRKLVTAELTLILRGLMLDRLRRFFLRQRAVPTTMHITHAKAGSTWIDQILRDLFGASVAPRGRTVAADRNLTTHRFEAGRIYSAMFMTREQFLAHPELRDIKRFFVMRDLRDTLISLYFSLKVSHPLDSPEKFRERELMQSLDPEQGLLHLLREQLHGVAAIQKSWTGVGEIVLRYEEVIANSEPLLRELFVDKLRLPVSPRAIARAAERRSFEKTFGRRLGEENVASHGRKGAPGDWRNHFTPAVTQEFQRLYGEHLISTGYERDASWAHVAA